MIQGLISVWMNEKIFFFAEPIYLTYWKHTLDDVLLPRHCSIKPLGLPTTKHVLVLLYLGCIQNFNFSINFHPFGPVSIRPHENCRAKLKSFGHPRTKLKKMFCGWEYTGHYAGFLQCHWYPAFFQSMLSAFGMPSALGYYHKKSTF